MKIALIGTAAGEMEAPFEDESFEIWCLNWNTPKYSRATLDFEIHTMRQGEKVVHENNGVPTITQDNYPHEWMENNLPRYLQNYFYKSSLDYMLAYAYYKHMTAKKKADKVELVQIHGVAMSMNDDEYFKQQPSFHAWIGFCLSHFDVVVDDHSPLMKTTFVYGLGEPSDGDPLYNLGTFNEMAEQEDTVIAEIKRDIELSNAKLQAHSGTKQVWEMLKKAERAKLAGQKIESLSKLLKSIK